MTTTPVETETAALSHDLAMYAARLTRAIRRQSAQPAAVRVLSLVDELGPSTVSALAEADRCSQPTMSALVTDLVDTGRLARRPHPDDARASLIDLTADGRTGLARVRDRNAELLSGRARAAGLTPEELATTVRVLRGLLVDAPTSTSEES